jgi:hypothetical protein
MIIRRPNLGEYRFGSSLVPVYGFVATSPLAPKFHPCGCGGKKTTRRRGLRGLGQDDYTGLTPSGNVDTSWMGTNVTPTQVYEAQEGVNLAPSAAPIFDAANPLPGTTSATGITATVSSPPTAAQYTQIMGGPPPNSNFSIIGGGFTWVLLGLAAIVGIGIMESK